MGDRFTQQVLSTKVTGKFSDFKRLSIVRLVTGRNLELFSRNRISFSLVRLTFTVIGGGSRGGSGSSVEPPKLNVKAYNNAWLKKSEPTHPINIS